jgi:hypothetical protein
LAGEVAGGVGPVVGIEVLDPDAGAVGDGECSAVRSQKPWDDERGERPDRIAELGRVARS